jgi:hypothetical protein
LLSYSHDSVTPSRLMIADRFVGTGMSGMGSVGVSFTFSHAAKPATQITMTAAHPHLLPFLISIFIVSLFQNRIKTPDRTVES